MAQRILVGVAALVLSFAGAGCSDDDGDPAAGSPPASAPAQSPEDGADESDAVPAPAYFETAVTPERGAAPGAELTSRGTGAEPATAYYCLLAVYDTAGGGVSAPLESSITQVTSSPDGEVTCTLDHQAYSAADDEGVERHCPTTAADRADGFSCGVVLVDAATLGAQSASAAPYAPRAAR